MQKPHYPSAVKQVLDRLECAGFAAYIVGGALRDMLLGREAHDFDVTTAALPEDMERVFSDLPLLRTGLKHGTMTVLIDHYPVEVTTFRIDGQYRDARHPEDVAFTDRIEEDLSRRDFTVNAMAYSEVRGLVDVFDGRADLSARVIRAVGDPIKRFSEDALRILRAYRFASKLDFTVDGATLDATVTCRGGLSRISAERITSELCGLLEGIAAERALALMTKNGIWQAFAPEFSVPEHAFEHLGQLSPVFEVRLAYFLRDCPDKGESLLQSLRLSNASLSRIRGLLRLRGELRAPIDPVQIRRLMASAGKWELDLDSLLSTGGFFPLSPEESQAAVSMIQEARTGKTCLFLSDLAVNGKMLISEGFAGREIGHVLAWLLDQVLVDPTLNSTDRLLALARSFRDRKPHSNLPQKGE